MEHLKSWINTLLHSIETEVDVDVGIKIIENCWRACANDSGAAEIKYDLRAMKSINL